jgi:peptidoglycan L-alanyl-D-glutamate endopeptidase CwlK
MQSAVQDLLVLAESRGLHLLMTCTRRSAQEQAQLYAVGHSLAEIVAGRGTLMGLKRPDLAALMDDLQPIAGKMRTRALPGQSAHQYGLAVDCVPLVAGKPIWDVKAPEWKMYGATVEDVGLEWAGTWKTFKEFPHAQMPAFNWREMIRP